ncbi:hypothetical protein [Streptomyces caniscabiei]|nr:hypothetical protein [Streptomyces caniscabiei]
MARVTNPVKRAEWLSKYSLAQIPPGHSTNSRFPELPAGDIKK